MIDHGKSQLVIEAMMKSRDMDDDASYLSRGSPYSTDSDDEIKNRWVVSFKSYLLKSTPDRRRAFADCCAELRFRNMAQPHEAVPSEMADINRRLDGCRPDDRAEIKQALAKYFEKIKNPDA